MPKKTLFVRQFAVYLDEVRHEIVTMHISKQIDSKIERIEARVRSEDKKLFKKAAELSGMKFTEFAIQAMKDAANKIIKEHTLIELSQADQKLFVERLMYAAEPNESLVAAAKRYKKMIQEQ